MLWDAKRTLLKFDGVAGNRDKELDDLQGFGVIEYACYLMDKSGNWSLSPAFDFTFSFNPVGHWTASHQMTLNGKRGNFTLDDFKACAKMAVMKRGRAEAIVREVQEVASNRQVYAENAGMPFSWQMQI